MLPQPSMVAGSLVIAQESVNFKGGSAEFLIADDDFDRDQNLLSSPCRRVSFPDHRFGNDQNFRDWDCCLLFLILLMKEASIPSMPKITFPDRPLPRTPPAGGNRCRSWQGPPAQSPERFANSPCDCTNVFLIILLFRSKSAKASGISSWALLSIVLAAV